MYTVIFQFNYIQGNTHDDKCVFLLKPVGHVRATTRGHSVCSAAPWCHTSTSFTFLTLPLLSVGSSPHNCNNLTKVCTIYISIYVRERL